MNSQSLDGQADTEPAGKHVLIVDDDPNLRQLLAWNLQQEGYEVSCASNGIEAIAMVTASRPDVVILDVVMPRLNGYETCLRLRGFYDAPIIFLSGSGTERDIIRGLNYGADDYLVKPFSLGELKARLSAILRRADGQSNLAGPTTFDDGTLYINLQTRCVRKQGKVISLAPKEFRLLAHLVRREGAVVPHSELLYQVWGPGSEEEYSYLSLYVRYLRRKLEDDPSNPQYIRTRFRVGYYFCGPSDYRSDSDG